MVLGLALNQLHAHARYRQSLANPGAAQRIEAAGRAIAAAIHNRRAAVMADFEIPEE
jgi:hypothetical protein